MPITPILRAYLNNEVRLDSKGLGFRGYNGSI